jgi:hypothetical protein
MTRHKTSVTSGAIAVSASDVTAKYCTNCALGVLNPVIVNLSVSAPAIGDTRWTATDSLTGSAQGAYTFTISPAVTNASYSSGNFLNVGTYVMTPSDVQTVSGKSTNYDTNQAIVYTAGSLLVNPLTLTFGSQTPTKQYDGTNSLNNVSLSAGNVKTSDVLTVSGNGQYATVNASTSVGYTISSAVLGGADAANYQFVPSLTGTTGVITKAPISITATFADKVYDGTTSVKNAISSPTATLSSGQLFAQSGVADSLSGGTFNYSDANAGIGNKILQLSAADILNAGLSVASNYSITYVDNTTSTIRQAGLALSGATTYNGSSTVASSDLVVKGVGSDTFAATGGSATMNSPNAGTNTLVSTSSLTFGAGGSSPGLLANYDTSALTLGKVTVSPANISVTASNAIKTYDANTTVTGATTQPTAQLSSGTLYAVNGLQDTLSGGSFTFTNASAGAGNKLLTVSGVSVMNNGSSASGNYNISYVSNTTSTINKADLTVTASDAIKTYNGSTSVAGASTAPSLILVSGSLLSSLGIQHVLSGGAFSYADANAGSSNKTLNVSGVDILHAGVSVASNYNITYSNNLTSTINPAAITVSASNAIKTYDGSTGLAGATTTPTASLTSGTLFMNGGVQDTLSGGTFTFASASAGSSKTLNFTAIDVLNGVSSVTSNYLITYVNNTTSTINAAPVTISASPAVKNYDGTTSVAGATTVPAAILSSGTLFTTNGIQDALSGGTFAYTSAAVGTAKTLTVSGVNILNGLSPVSSNYTITYLNNFLSQILEVILNGGGGGGGTGGGSGGGSGGGTRVSGTVNNPIIFSPINSSNSPASNNPIFGISSSASISLDTMVLNSDVGTQSAVRFVQQASSSVRTSAFILTQSNMLADPQTFDTLKRQPMILVTQDITGSNDPGRLLAIAKSDGFTVTVSDSALTSSITQGSNNISVVFSNEKPAPSWLTIDPASKQLSAETVPLENLPLQVKVHHIDGTKLLSESVVGLTEF